MLPSPVRSLDHWADGWDLIEAESAWPPPAASTRVLETLTQRDTRGTSSPPPPLVQVLLPQIRSDSSEPPPPPRPRRRGGVSRRARGSVRAPVEQARGNLSIPRRKLGSWRRKNRIFSGAIRIELRWSSGLGMEIQSSGRSIDGLMERVLSVNILSSDYFKELYKFKTYHEVVDEIYHQVDHVEPWMTGNCRGPSSAFCLLYKFFTMKLTVNQMHGLLKHPDSPYIRAVSQSLSSSCFFFCRCFWI